jgi:hypothetical protein
MGYVNSDFWCKKHHGLSSNEWPHSQNTLRNAIERKKAVLQFDYNKRLSPFTMLTQGSVTLLPEKITWILSLVREGKDKPVKPIVSPLTFFRFAPNPLDYEHGSATLIRQT